MRRLWFIISVKATESLWNSHLGRKNVLKYKQNNSNENIRKTSYSVLHIITIEKHKYATVYLTPPKVHQQCSKMKVCWQNKDLVCVIYHVTYGALNGTALDRVERGHLLPKSRDRKPSNHGAACSSRDMFLTSYKTRDIIYLIKSPIKSALYFNIFDISGGRAVFIAQ